LICWRVAALDPTPPGRARTGLLWFPRELQGEGRHDNPELYGCLYASEEPVSAVAESLAPFRGAGALDPSMLRRGGSPLYLGKITLPDETVILDLDDPQVLGREALRPSRVATRRRSVTQVQAARLHQAHPAAGALRWWSTIESTLINLTLFDRVQESLIIAESRELSVDDSEVLAACELLGLA
jgi:hypothetical protein